MSMSTISTAAREGMPGFSGVLVAPEDSDYDEVRKVYEKTSIRPYYGYHSGGHTMDYVLRQGEMFTRWFGQLVVKAPEFLALFIQEAMASVAFQDGEH